MVGSPNVRVGIVSGVALLLLALVTACGTSGSRTPLPLASPLVSFLPTPGVEPSTMRGALPTPSTSDTATVGGVALRQTPGQPSYPLNGGILFLAQVQYYDDKPVMGILDTSTAPRAVADEQGFFVFTNVPPGSYVLIYATPMGSIVLQNPQTGADMIIEVEGGAIVDLGELKYDVGF